MKYEFQTALEGTMNFNKGTADQISLTFPERPEIQNSEINYYKTQSSKTSE